MATQAFRQKSKTDHLVDIGKLRLGTEHIYKQSLNKSSEQNPEIDFLDPNFNMPSVIDPKRKYFLTHKKKKKVQPKDFNPKEHKQDAKVYNYVFKELKLERAFDSKKNQLIKISKKGKTLKNLTKYYLRDLIIMQI